MSAEQWKEGGNCDKCRRKAYCTKTCTAEKRKAKAIERAVGDAILRSICPQLADKADKFRY